MMKVPLSAIIFAVISLMSLQAHAQIFQNFFGGGQQYEAREQEAPSSGDASWFEARVEAATCTQYLCPRTLSCVTSPASCPCPFPHQIRCAYPDSETGKMETGGHICIQEDNCDNVNKARQIGRDFKMSNLKQ